MNHLYFIMACCLVLSNPASSTEKPEKWKVWYEDGSGGGTKEYSSKKKSVDDPFLEDMIAIHEDLKFIHEHEKKLQPHPEIKEIGEWKNFTVYDLIDQAIPIKQIVLKDKNDHFFLLYSLCPVDAKLSPSFIVDKDKHLILATRCRMAGTGNFYYETYFILDAKTKMPVSLDLDVINDILKTLLPKGFEVWKGGGFNINSLIFTNFVWKEGDGNAGPTGGKVMIKFKIQNNQLVPIDEKYEAASQ